MSKVKLGKTDSIIPEMQKYLPISEVIVLRKLIRKKEVPPEWEAIVIVPIH